VLKAVALDQSSRLERIVLAVSSGIGELEFEDSAGPYLILPSPVSRCLLRKLPGVRKVEQKSKG
jgi:hypothetical protein